MADIISNIQTQQFDTDSNSEKADELFVENNSDININQNDMETRLSEFVMYS